MYSHRKYCFLVIPFTASSVGIVIVDRIFFCLIFRPAFIARLNSYDAKATKVDFVVLYFRLLHYIHKTTAYVESNF